MSAPRIPAYELLARSMGRVGVGTVFGLLGDGNIDVIDALVSNESATYVPVNREDIAVSAADGFSRVSGGVGVAAITHGPGLTNAVTAIHEAARSRTPLLVLCGDTDPSDRAHNQAIDQRATVAPTGAEFVSVESAGRVAHDFTHAYALAVGDRRPVVLNLPTQVLVEEVIPQEVAAPTPHRSAPQIDEAALDVALGVLATALRPVVVAGRGVVDAGAHNQVLGLANAIGAPVATTLKARGLFRGESLDLGVCGTVSSLASAEVLGEADCLVVFGAGLNRYTTSYGSLLDGKTVIQVDSDPQAFGRWYPVDVGVIGDVGTTASLMHEALAESGHSPRPWGSRDVADRLAAQSSLDEFVDVSTDSAVDPRALMIWLNETVPPDRIVVCDVGGFMEVPLRHLDVIDPRAHVLPAAFGSVGLSMAAAIGAGIASPNRPTLAVMGDGGWMMGGINALDTAVSLGLDLVVCVLNDGGYGIEHRALVAKGSDPSVASMQWPPPHSVARTLGAESISVKSKSDLTGAELLVNERRGPVLIDATIPM